MNVVNSQEIKLSSKFTRFLLDSIHSITPRTKLNEFVDIINYKGNVGFKARLRSNNPTIPVSFFLQAPLFKYINYAELADTYQLENEIQSSCQFERMIEPNLNEEPNLEKEEDIFYFEEEEEKQEKPKMPLTYDEVIQIIDETIQHYCGNEENMYKLRNKRVLELKRVSFKLDYNSAEIFNWLAKKYQMDCESYLYASKLGGLANCYPKKFKKIKKYLKKKVQDIISM